MFAPIKVIIDLGCKGMYHPIHNIKMELNDMFRDEPVMISDKLDKAIANALIFAYEKERKRERNLNN